MVIEEIKSTNAQIDTFSEEPATKKKNHQTMIHRIDNLSAEKKNYFEGKDEGKPNGIISILSKLSDKFISFEKTGPSINWELSKIFRNLLFAIGKQKKNDYKRRTDLLEKNPQPKTVIFLLRGLIPKFWDRYQRLQDQRISYNNFFKNPTQSFLLRVFELVAYVLEKLVGKDPNVKMRKFHR